MRISVKPGQPRRVHGQRWPAWSALGLGAVLAALLTLAIGNFQAAQRSSDASLLAVTAQRELLAYLRGVNEVLLTEGSSGALTIVQRSGAAFEAAIVRLKQTVSLAENQATITQDVEPGWRATSGLVKELLAQKNIAASDDDAMLAYGKISGVAEKLVEAVAVIEQRTGPAAARAIQQLTWSVGASLGVAVLLILAIGRTAIQSLYNRLGSRPDEVQKVAARLAQHDLSVAPPASGARDRSTLLDALSDIQNNLAMVVGRVKENATAVEAAAQEIANGNQDLSARTEAQAGALEETSSSMRALDVTVQENTERVRMANGLTASASEVARKGGEVVGEVVQTMQGIQHASGRIADITSVIDGIAFQTNILALNAAVEAARAGEQGRGFAVVASEVRSLAQRSAAAAKEIKDLIANSVDSVRHGTALVDRAGSTMKEIVQAIEQVTTIMAEISSSGEHQSDGVSQVVDAVRQMDHGTQQNAALAEQTSAAAESLAEQARQLVESVAVFKLASHQQAAMAATPSLGHASEGPDLAPHRPRPRLLKP